MALMAWLVADSQDTISQIFFVYILAFLIPVGGLTHCIAGPTEVLVGVFTGEATFFEYLGLFLVPTTLGNIVGGWCWSRCSTMGKLHVLRRPPRPSTRAKANGIGSS